MNWSKSLSAVSEKLWVFLFVHLKSNQMIIAYLPFIQTYDPNNPNFHEMIEKFVESIKRNKVDGFKNIRIIESKQQAPNLQKNLT